MRLSCDACSGLQVTQAALSRWRSAGACPGPCASAEPRRASGPWSRAWCQWQSVSDDSESEAPPAGHQSGACQSALKQSERSRLPRRRDSSSYYGTRVPWYHGTRVLEYAGIAFTVDSESAHARVRRRRRHWSRRQHMPATRRTRVSARRRLAAEIICQWPCLAATTCDEPRLSLDRVADTQPVPRPTGSVTQLPVHAQEFRIRTRPRNANHANASTTASRSASTVPAPTARKVGIMAPIHAVFVRSSGIGPTCGGGIIAGAATIIASRLRAGTIAGNHSIMSSICERPVPVAVVMTALIV